MSNKPKGQKGISIYLRVRPTKKPSGFFKFDREEGKVDFEVPVEQIHGHVNNTRQNYKFRFNGLFDMKANQEEVFDGVAVGAVNSALAGFNSTIFAYGQTGSGKTFTITGGAERYVDRGIIPRTLSYIFNEATENSERKITLYISYMEIYNETAYDLLDPSHETKQLEDLPRVSFMEDDDGNVHLRGLSMHVANNEEEALNLLFLGDTNRAISETPMNMASSRSHCVFSISVESRETGSDVIRRSKLHIVDLAGSERAHKTGARGQILREAKFINTSLHYLEMVIVALHERKTKGRTHVPYRNSLMTSLLRDSLGGNCHTTMIATISAEKTQTEESISTCRFAQRVALVQNEAYVNEEVDPASVIQRLKAEVKSLKEEVNFLKRQLGEGDEDEREMAGHEIDRLRDLVQAFFDARETDPNQPMGFGGNPTFPRIQMALKILRDMVAERGGGRGKGSGGYGGKSANSDMEDIDRLDAEIAELKDLLAHRDNEISILVNMVKQGKTIPADGSSNNFNSNSRPRSSSPHGTNENINQEKNHEGSKRSSHSEVKVTAEILADKKKSFEIFRTTYHSNQAVEENKGLLRQRYMEAKAMGKRVNDARGNINKIKKRIEQLRLQQQQFKEENDDEAMQEATQTENDLKKEMDKFKVDYKQNFNTLRKLKSEIEQIQKQLERQRIRMQSDFESWHSVMLREVNENNENGSSYIMNERSPQSRFVKDAWRGDSAKGNEREGKTSSSYSPPQEAKKLMTGNKDADEDIMAFFKAKEEMMKRVKG
jgi:kinesin family member 6/9